MYAPDFSLPKDGSELPAVVGPMQQRLALTAPTGEVAAVTVTFDLADVPAHCFPALDLPPVLVGDPPAHVVAAVPLEPAARIVRMDPALGAPDGQRLTGIDAEIVE